MMDCTFDCASNYYCMHLPLMSLTPSPTATANVSSHRRHHHHPTTTTTHKGNILWRNRRLFHICATGAKVRECSRDCSALPEAPERRTPVQSRQEVLYLCLAGRCQSCWAGLGGREQLATPPVLQRSALGHHEPPQSKRRQPASIGTVTPTPRRVPAPQHQKGTP